MTHPKILTPGEVAGELELMESHPSLAEHSVRELCASHEALRVERDGLAKRLAWYESGDVHTCHDECERPQCVQYRRLTRYEEALRRYAEADWNGNPIPLGNGQTVRGIPFGLGPYIAREALGGEG